MPMLLRCHDRIHFNAKRVRGTQGVFVVGEITAAEHAHGLTPPKAAICGALTHVRFGPKADI